MLYVVVVPYDGCWLLVSTPPLSSFLGMDVNGSHFWCRLEYTWIDSSRKQVKLPAPTYVDYVFTWIQILLDDPTVFPTKNGTFCSAHSYSHDGLMTFL